ncbi:MAG: CAP domain-containing protein [Planctomycetaceae bacterium]|nr:CAP domain-containing protein [Planctomycetaceae bacterium]
MQQTSRTARLISLEAMQLMSATTTEGTSAGEWLSGTDADNIILAGGGNDEIHAPIGDNTIDGGSGTDVLHVYEGNRGSYALNQLSDGSWELSGPGLNGQQMSARLTNVERISFNDQQVILDTAAQTVQPPSSQASPTAPAAETGSAAGEWISGTAGNDAINAGDGDDTIHAPLGNNQIDGGSGFDTFVIYQGSRADWTIRQLSTGEVEVSGRGLNGVSQVNTLRNVEAIAFNDAVVDPNGINEAAETFAAESEFQPAPAPAPASAGDQPAISEPFIADPQPEPEPASISAPDDFVTEVVRLTNVIRAENGLPPVTLDAELQSAASDHSADMAFRDFFGHVNLEGQQPWDRALEAGYDYQTIGENIAAGQLTPAEVVQAWYDSASHRENILNPAFREIGIGYTFLASDTGGLNYNHYWTQLFGTER